MAHLGVWWVAPLALWGHKGFRGLGFRGCPKRYPGRLCSGGWLSARLVQGVQAPRLRGMSFKSLNPRF